MNRYISNSKTSYTSRVILLGILFILIGLFFYKPLYSYSVEETEEISLANVLNKCATYCEKLDNSSLFFVCKERIKEVWYHTLLGHTNIYVYDYQLIRKDNKIKESRILIQENGKKKHEKDAQLKTNLFYYKNILFGPVGLFSEFWQKHYNYKIIKEEKYKGEKAIVIEVIPLTQEAGDNLYGKVWVNKDDFSILRIEWNPKSISNYKLTEAIANNLRAWPQITITAEYAFEKNGIRFPSKFYIYENYICQTGRRITRSITTVVYEDYKFFTVETEVKY